MPAAHPTVTPGLPSDEPGPGCLDVPDEPDRNLTRYAGPRPSDGEQNASQDPTPYPGSPTGSGSQPAQAPDGPARYRKRPVVVEAIRWAQGDGADVREFLGEAYLGGCGPGRIKVDTLEGAMPLCRGDWVVKGLVGEFWVCRADVFAATYEPTDAPPTTLPYPGDDGPQGCR